MTAGLKVKPTKEISSRRSNNDNDNDSSDHSSSNNNNNRNRNNNNDNGNNNRDCSSSISFDLMNVVVRASVTLVKIVNHFIKLGFRLKQIKVVGRCSEKSRKLRI